MHATIHSSLKASCHEWWQPHPFYFPSWLSLSVKPCVTYCYIIVPAEWSSRESKWPLTIERRLGLEQERGHNSCIMNWVIGPKQRQCDSTMFKKRSHWYSKILAIHLGQCKDIILGASQCEAPGRPAPNSVLSGWWWNNSGKLHLWSQQHLSLSY